MFSPDQLVVYPAQGVGRIVRIENQIIGGVQAEFYVITILSNNVTLMIPTKSAARVGLRELCNADECQDVLKNLQDRTGFSGYAGKNWNRRCKEYSEKLKSGNLLDVAHVLKELILISKEKELSFGERRLQEQSMELIVLEIANAQARTQEDVTAEIESYFADILHPEPEEGQENEQSV